MNQDTPKRPRQAKAAAKDALSPIKRSALEPAQAKADPKGAAPKGRSDAATATSVHPAPTTPASEAEPGAAALTSVATVAADPPAGKTSGREDAAPRSTTATSGNSQTRAKARVEPAADLASNAVLSVPTPALLPGAQAAMEASVDQARAASVQVRQASENVGQVVTESASSATRGLVELNGKMFDLWRAQSDAAFRVWRSVMTAGSLAEAVRAQTSGMREVYELTISQWKELAETTGRLVGDTAKSVKTTRPPER